MAGVAVDTIPSEAWARKPDGEMARHGRVDSGNGTDGSCLSSERTAAAQRYAADAHGREGGWCALLPDAGLLQLEARYPAAQDSQQPCQLLRLRHEPPAALDANQHLHSGTACPVRARRHLRAGQVAGRLRLRIFLWHVVSGGQFLRLREELDAQEGGGKPPLRPHSEWRGE